MPQKVILFHSVLGLRPAVAGFAERMRAGGHVVYTPDLFNGRVFEALEDGVLHVRSIGISALIEKAQRSAAELPADAVYAGFSLGASAAQLLAATRVGARGAVLMHGVLSLSALGVATWPQVPVQIHYAEDDPWVEAEEVESLSAEVRKSNQECSVYRYGGSAHLFADDGSREYDRAAAESMIERVLAFLHCLDDR